MRIAIFGCGALGTILGAYIEKNKGNCPLNLEEVDLFSRNKAHVEKLNNEGAKVVGFVNFQQKVRAFLPEEINGKYKYIILMTKVIENSKTVPFLKDYLQEDGAIITCQNGLPENEIASIVGKDRTLGCTVGWGATYQEPGVSKLTSSENKLTVDLGAISSGGKEKLQDVEKIFSLMNFLIFNYGSTNSTSTNYK
ncbi:MAG: hypothetical protein HUK24_05950, partial [Sphaerochaetaceae bacterium]|nr:hypothetical protein [Sphaerochaetaceae bacterium]